jgi:hypothetical protein
MPSGVRQVAWHRCGDRTILGHLQPMRFGDEGSTAFDRAGKRFPSACALPVATPKAPVLHSDFSTDHAALSGKPPQCSERPLEKLRRLSNRPLLMNEVILRGAESGDPDVLPTTADLAGSRLHGAGPYCSYRKSDRSLGHGHAHSSISACGGTLTIASELIAPGRSSAHMFERTTEMS